MRKGGIDCLVCMFGAPFPDCCLHDCGKQPKCNGCAWYAKHVFKVTAKEREENQDGKEKKMD